MFVGCCPLMVLWFLIKLMAVVRPSLHDGFRFRQCVSIFVVDDFGLRRPLSSDLFNRFANFRWVLVRLFQMLTPLFEIISLVCICRLHKLLVELCPSFPSSSALSRAPLFCYFHGGVFQPCFFFSLSREDILICYFWHGGCSFCQQFFWCTFLFCIV